MKIYNFLKLEIQTKVAKIVKNEFWKKPRAAAEKIKISKKPRAAAEKHNNTSVISNCEHKDM